MGKLRVLVVEDSLTIRKFLAEVLAADPAIEVVAEAEDGQQAIALCEALRPDVVSLDMMMPVMSGLAATEYIMAYCPTPILIVSSSVNRGEVFNTYEALSAGAVDVLDKPGPAGAGSGWEKKYCQSIKMVSRIRVITHPRARLVGLGMGGAERAEIALGPIRGAFRCIAIGASAGGPGAVVQLLKAMPANFPIPILLVIHIGMPFGVALAEWLDTVSPIRVTTAFDGQPVPDLGQSQVIMAPPERHMGVRDNRLFLNEEPERHSCRPSIDVLFESLAREMGSSVIACLLTGMGRDGARGLLAIRQAGGMTIAQDEESCVVFGMPREAIKLNAARQVLGLTQIAPALLQLARPQWAQGRGATP